ncbi:PREDICTED: RING finger protein 11-like [Buceros rhinoceros silvestris]|uniref:RING finger protein 11-like n=1 Tax=Buceros rhinoceros silvestris TaxID=175836 RepID=UPI0005292641|nr:PREDICTED: RING finger protein 11-like [Buceros rhinoceros silvestris]
MQMEVPPSSTAGVVVVLLESKNWENGSNNYLTDTTKQAVGVEEPDKCFHFREQVPVPVYHPTPSQTRLATQLTEEEQIRIAQRIGLIQHLPKGVYDPGRDGSEKKIRECVICMMDFVYGDPIRFLPCMHIYHLDCIDDWLMRSFTCPSCMEPVDAALLSSYETN